MDVSYPLVLAAQSPEAMQPAQRSFDHPAPTAQTLPTLDGPRGIRGWMPLGRS